MSMYNAIFGNNPFGWMHLVAIGTSIEDVPRFRDCYLHRCTDGTTRILVLTRTGSEEYQEQNEPMISLPGFSSTSLLSRDGTYRVFLYDLPFDDYEERIKPVVEQAIDENNKREVYESRGGFESLYGPHPDDRWGQFFADLDSGADNENTRRALETGKKIFGEMGLM